MNMPLVNIIVPCYNVERYVSKCLDSLLNQTYSNIRIICINDGSTDGTLEILKQYNSKDSKIILINQENKGLSETRNVGLSLCERGSFVSFVDSDDWVDSHMIETCIKGNEDMDVVLMQGLFQAWDDGSTRTKYVFRENQCQHIDGEEIKNLISRVIGLSEEEIKHPEYNDSLSSACLKMYNMRIILDYNVSFGSCRKYGTEDWLFNVEYFLNIKSAVIVPYIGYYYRRTINSLTRRGYRPELLNQWLTLYQRVWDDIQGMPYTYSPYWNHRALSIIGASFNAVSISPYFLEQVRKEKEVLEHPLYKGVYENFPIKSLTFPWKCYFFLVKHSCACLLTVLIHFINFCRTSKGIYRLYKKVTK